MIEVYKITEQQKDLLVGQEYTQDMFFYPIQDANGNWIISQIEVNQCDNIEFDWIKNLEKIEYFAVINDL